MVTGLARLASNLPVTSFAGYALKVTSLEVISKLQFCKIFVYIYLSFLYLSYQGIKNCSINYPVSYELPVKLVVNIKVGHLSNLTCYLTLKVVTG